jgi:hypothetical protein
MLNFVKAFFCIYEMVVWFLSLILFMCCITLIDCIGWTILISLECNQLDHGMIFSVCCWIWFATILLRILASMFMKEISLYFLLMCSHLVLVSGWYLLHRMNLIVFLLFLTYGIVWRGLMLVLVWRSGRIQQYFVWPGPFFIWETLLLLQSHWSL